MYYLVIYSMMIQMDFDLKTWADYGCLALKWKLQNFIL